MSTRFLSLFLIAFNFAAVTAASAQNVRQYADLQSFTIKHNGTERTFGLYVPRTYAKGRATPLIVALHGRFSSAKALHAISKLQDVADARGALLLYPEAVGAFWDDGGHAVFPRGEAPAGDPAFIGEVISAVMAAYSVDRDRLYLLGYDSGGTMALRMVCQSPVRFSAIAIVSALMWQFTAESCPSNRQPISILFVHGRESKVYPVNGAEPQSRIASARLSAADTVDFWRRGDGCAAAPSATGGDGGVVFQNCQSGTSIAYVGVPGGSQDWSRIGDDYQLNRHSVSTAALVDTFFFDRARFSLPSAHGSSERTRDYLLYVSPLYEAKKPTPIIVMLHGRPSNAPEMARITDMNSVAARLGFIVVYPEGLNHEWNTQFDPDNKTSVGVHAFVREPGGLRQDDVGFLKTLMADLRVDLNIDPRRMYIAGFSNGGFMTLRMACSASETFAAFAEVGSALYPAMTEICGRAKPAPMLFMHGTLDQSIPIDGVNMRDPQTRMPIRVTLSVRETVALFARRNNCAESGIMTTFAETGRSPGTKLTRYVPHDCAPNAPIAFYIIEGGGHTWPGTAGILDETKFGLTNMDMNASEIIWEFVSAQKLGN